MEPWLFKDFVLFANSSTNDGTPIIFENKDKTDGLIQSGDWIGVKSTKANSDAQYWAFNTRYQSVYLVADTAASHRIYGSSKDNSIGIITSSGITSDGAPTVWQYKGDHTEKAWMKPSWSPLSSDEDIQTPLEVIEVSESYPKRKKATEYRSISQHFAEIGSGAKC
ncbi:hypothetical protein [Bacillus thuringiensis]|uniref:hypothetical protein n=1 Tax=Bacillus thuringiensis TaxID=1428 RepID=UPI000B712093|nr:hypothetical protein [Bacillus thuringiensis]MEC2865076.1 hypothetical protein [Bacillus cereus]OUB78512.1 hypothetical protein BK773_29190 [Bacillus thuringiensis serovar indiana]